MLKSNLRRDAGLDALRASLTLLVLFHHTAITYGGSGDWYYKEAQSGHDLSSLLLSLFAGFNQAFFMGLFFLVAGYFTPRALERRGAAACIRRGEQARQGRAGEGRRSIRVPPVSFAPRPTVIPGGPEV